MWEFCKKELCKMVVEVQKKSNRVMTVVIALEEELVRIMCVCSTKWQNG